MPDELKVTPAPWQATAVDHKTHHGAGAAIWGPDGDAVALVWGNLGEDSDALATALWIVQQRNRGVEGTCETS